MRSLRALVLYLFEDGRLTANPFARKHGRGGSNPLLPVAVTPTKGATLQDIEALERGCQGRTPADLRDQAIVALMKTTSARNSSIRLLRVQDVDLDRGIVTFWNAKMARTYESALQPEARAAVVRYLARGRPSFLPRYTVRGYEHIVAGEDPGYLFLARRNGRSQAVGPLTDNGLSTMLNRRYQIGGGTLPSFRSHRIRHGTATLLGNNGMGIDELSRHLGHSTTRLTRRYAVQTTDTIGRLAYGAMAASGLTQQPQRRGRR